MATEDRGKETELEGLYKTKVVQFLGRSVPIILQNDNGPCPLIAISNVLLLRNNLNLSLDTSEISLQKLLSLVAERLIDSNSNVEDKDVGFVKNQQQNIADAIDMLPRLATGIDVNLHFRKIDDFEFTPERAMFDLLGIELYHGWIVDPQDTDTLDAIGSKSYNALISELVALETRNGTEEDKGVPEEDCIDFAAATTATLGVPCPSLSRGRSFEDSSVSIKSDQRLRKGDLEEEEELMRVLQLSRTESPPSLQSGEVSELNVSTACTTSCHPSSAEESISGVLPSSSLQDNVGSKSQSPQAPEQTISHNSHSSCNDVLLSESAVCESENAFSQVTAINHQCPLISNDSGELVKSDNLVESARFNIFQNQTAPLLFSEKDVSPALSIQDGMSCSPKDHLLQQASVEDISAGPDNLKPTDNQSSEDLTMHSDSLAPHSDSDSPSIRPAHIDEDVASSLAGSEPIYEGEECILDSGHSSYENQEPIYEGEIVLAEQADRVSEGNACGRHSVDKTTQQSDSFAPCINAKEGELIQNFLKDNASQLTIYGLFCLQEGLKERELCVFFRNNHFSTMFKFNDVLYLLATDQGYLNQPDLVWEKLNEVNGDSVFMTGDFKEFKAENHLNGSWNEQNALTSTADYLASIDNGVQESSTLSSDFQLAIALQQQEFESQPQRQNPTNSQKPSLASHSRLVTGPQVPRTSSTSPKQDSKTKDKCVVM